MQNACDMSKLLSYEIENNYVFLVFNNFACAVFDLSTLTISREEFEDVINKVISKNKLTKTK